MAQDGDERTFRSLGVCDQLVEACESLGWKTPSKIQVEAIPHALEGRDVIGLAQTGSGKTGAFALPIIQALLEKPQPLFACILSPTRELAIQISQQFEALGSSIGVKCSVVGTPGRLLDHLSNTKGFSLRMLKYLVLDEADRLLNMEFEKAIDDILKDIPRERRTYLFSATMTKKVGKLQRACLKNPVKIEASSKYSTVDTLKQQFRLVPAKYKVGTPGRLLDHLSNTKGFSLHMLKYLVLDEADRLLNMDLEKAIDDILKAIPRERRTYLFSATMTKKERVEEYIKENFTWLTLRIEASSKYSTVDTLKQQFRLVPAKYKDCYRVYILIEMSGSTSMVFTRTCDSTRLLALLLRNLGLKAIPISGQMSQTKRLGALNKFKAGDCNILICTDVASRGLDIPSVDLVINYDIPSNSKDYIHRVGRTARAGRSGLAISLVNQYEVEWYIQIEQLIGKKLLEFPAEEAEVLLFLERVSDAKRISQMKIKESAGNKRRRKVGDDEE